MMHLSRVLSGENWKGTKGYLDSQRSYELVRTILLFSVSGLLFVAGWIGSGSRMNLLTVVAVLGCLPASKSMVSLIMFCRYHSLSEERAQEIKARAGALTQLFDLVFTGNEKNFQVDHMAIKGNTVCGYSGQKNFDEAMFDKHLSGILKADSLTGVSIKIFTDLQKYLARLEQMQELACDEKNTGAIAETLKSVSL